MMAIGILLLWKIASMIHDETPTNSASAKPHLGPWPCSTKPIFPLPRGSHNLWPRPQIDDYLFIFPLHTQNT